MKQVWTQLRWSLSQRGFLGTVRTIVRKIVGKKHDHTIAEHPFDSRYGVDTGGLISGAMLAADHPHDRFSTAYYGVQPSRLRQALALWKDGLQGLGTQQFTFYDVGSGKGRALMIASEINFRHLIGVELNPDLHKVAVRNWAAFQASMQHGVIADFFQADATEVEAPEGPLLVFLYNPFRAVVMRKFLQKLCARQDGRPTYLLYMVPECANVVEEFPQLALVWSEVFMMTEQERIGDPVSSPNDRCNLYRLRDRQKERAEP
jgi:SAM-dependent methyltransferase